MHSAGILMPPEVRFLRLCITCTTRKLCPSFHPWKAQKNLEKRMEEPWPPKQHLHQPDPMGTREGAAGSGAGAHVPKGFW